MNHWIWTPACVLALSLASATAALAVAEGPTDAEIAAIVVAANQVDIDAGKLAQGKTQSTEIRALADRMVTDHTAVNVQATALVKKLNVTPRPNATSESLTRGGNDNLVHLRGLTGKSFDAAYVDHEVTYHQTVIDALDRTLIPGAKNAELQALLVKVRPAFVSHLEHAKHLKSTLGGDAPK